MTPAGARKSAADKRKALRDLGDEDRYVRRAAAEALEKELQTSQAICLGRFVVGDSSPRAFAT